MIFRKKKPTAEALEEAYAFIRRVEYARNHPRPPVKTRGWADSPNRKKRIAFWTTFFLSIFIPPLVFLAAFMDRRGLDVPATAQLRRIGEFVDW